MHTYVSEHTFTISVSVVHVWLNENGDDSWIMIVLRNKWYIGRKPRDNESSIHEVVKDSVFVECLHIK